jgi:hypothetical protein
MRMCLEEHLCAAAIGFAIRIPAPTANLHEVPS